MESNKQLKQRKNREVEVITSGSRVLMENAVRRLMKSQKRQKVLQVPDRDFQVATRIMRDVGLSGTVKNMSGTKTRYVNRQEIARHKKSRTSSAEAPYFRPYVDIWSMQF
ncbi:MAG: hypothetical protein KDD36_07705 [Flavobacteriales bacterium]|nr:hypothetical protein [Flavobacteriales bacterium]